MPPSTPRLIVEPDDGLDPVRELIESAQSSMLIKQFTLTEESLIEAVIGRKNAGVDVRVMLNAQRSGGDRANDDPSHVRQIVEVFTADWEHLDWDCAAYEGLLWSNSNSRYHMAQFIDLSNTDWIFSTRSMSTRSFPKINPLIIVAAPGVIGYFGVV